MAAMDPLGRLVLIGGASKGLGLLLAREFGNLGSRVIITARDQEELDEALGKLQEWGVMAEAMVCDVQDRTQVEATIAQAQATHGPIDILVNNAGIIQVGPLDTLTIADFEHAMATMFWGPVYATFAALPSMKERRSGRIVNITSIGGKVSVPRLLPYNAAKFAAVGFSEGLRAELAGTGVSAVTVVPGLMRTGSFYNALFKGSDNKQFGLFATMSSLPVLSISAEDAARRIVRATLNDEAELILSVPANLLARFHGLLPGVTTRMMSLTSRLLPSADSDRVGRTGAEAEASSQNVVVEKLTTLGRRAAGRFQTGEQEPVEREKEAMARQAAQNSE
jgi:short-subunit dehydrogenase